VKSADILKSITQEADADRERRLLAAARMAELEADHSDRLQHVLTGAALLSVPFKWELDTHTTHFAATWRTSQVYAELNLNLTILKVSSWSALTALFDLLDAQGISADKWTSEDDARSYSRVFTNKVLDDDGEGKKIIVRITASLPGDTETCKRVIVGYTKPVAYTPEPSPIYELHCEGDTK